MSADTLRDWMRIVEAMLVETFVVPPYLAEIAKKCNSVEEFIRATDGRDVLYRGHYEDKTGNNAFMTDYVGHAAEYAGGEGGDGRIDAFAYDPSDVFYYDDRRFDELRRWVRIANDYAGMTDQQFAAIYKPAIADGRLSNAMMNSGLKTGRQVVAKIKGDLRSETPYSTISGNSMVNDLLIPLLQMYAHTQGKNIIAFHGSDYADYGGQTEYVVADVSKLVDLRELYAKVHGP